MVAFAPRWRYAQDRIVGIPDEGPGTTASDGFLRVARDPLWNRIRSAAYQHEQTRTPGHFTGYSNMASS